MTREDVDLAVEWTAQEGWNPGLHDAESYYAVDSNGFLIGLLGDEPIATISVVKYGDAFGFLGFYIVKPGHRGNGYGKRIWDAGLRYLEGRTIGLDGVLAQQENYKRSGFSFAYRNVRYEGCGGGRAPQHAGLVDLASVPMDAVESYERPFFPAERSYFTRSWIAQPGANALGILRDGKLVGYGVMRPCRSGSKIGPLYADSPELAETLFLALKAEAPAADRVYLDVPEVNRAAVALARRHDMQAMFETARMYKGEAPVIDLERLFGVASFEIG
ncbi:GNAT family N-acetyltransferase [Methylogaea oryzae]|nr:GNAT family N-acetyltransferase [Methylogaea oryzae]